MAWSRLSSASLQLAVESVPMSPRLSSATAATRIVLCRHGVSQGCQLPKVLDAREQHRCGCVDPSRQDVMKLLP